MSIDLISNNLKQDISKILEKDVDEISQEDLLKIDKINFKSEDFLGNKTDYNIEDLVKLDNIKDFSIFLFEINNQDISILQKMKFLKYIQFDFCDFKIDNLCLNQNIESLFINHCKNIQDVKISGSLIKKINIIGDINYLNDFDIYNLERLNSLEELDIHYFAIKQLNDILKIAPNLKKINIDGSTATEDLVNLRDKVNFSQNEFYHLT